jgi:hypothetical protein
VRLGTSPRSSGLGAPARAQPVQLASLEVVTQSSSSTGLPQYVSLIWGLATCTLPSPLAWRIFTSGNRSGSWLYSTSSQLAGNTPCRPSTDVS